MAAATVNKTNIVPTINSQAGSNIALSPEYPYAFSVPFLDHQNAIAVPEAAGDVDDVSRIASPGDGYVTNRRSPS
jgi:hypothetical protein